MRSSLGGRNFEECRELCRVANELRIFPILTLAREPSPYLNPLIECLARDGWSARLERVGYEFQRGGNVMLRCTPCAHLRHVVWPRVAPLHQR